MRSVVGVLALIVMSVTVSGCGKKIEKESAAWRAQVDESIKRVEAAMDKAVLGIPGERYLRLIDSVNDPAATPEERKRAQDFIKRLFDIEIDSAYELSVHFAYDDTKPMEAVIALLPVNSKSAVEYYCLNRGTFNAEPVRNTLRRPPTWVESSEYIDQQLLAAIETLGAQVSAPKVVGGSNFVPKSLEYRVDQAGAIGLPLNTQAVSGGLYFAPGSRAKTTGISTIEEVEQTERRKAAARHLRNAIDAVYGDLKRPLNEPTFTRDFLPLSGKPWLVVMIEKKLVDAQPADKTFEVQAIVYKKLTDEQKAENEKAGRPREALNSQHPIEFRKEHFVDANRVVKCGNPAREIYYAAHNMTETETMTQEIYDAYLQTKELTRRWEAAQRGESTN